MQTRCSFEHVSCFINIKSVGKIKSVKTRFYLKIKKGKNVFSLHMMPITDHTACSVIG